MGLQERVSGALMASSDSFLSREGVTWTYTRGLITATIRFYQSDEPPALLDTGEGHLVEIILARFRGLTSDLEQFETPLKGDKIDNGVLFYEVVPNVDKCFYTIGSLIHIHAKRVRRVG